MTATYDGRLILDPKAKRVQPCCELMHEAVYSKTVYLGTSAKMPALVLRIGDKRGLVMASCPFCGAKVEGRQ